MSKQKWSRVCRLDDLEHNWGEVALIDGHQYAIFRLGDNRVFATDHADPASGSLVIARGIVGNRDGAPTICSPLYKEEYNLETGKQLGGELVLPVYPAKIESGEVFIEI